MMINLKGKLIYYLLLFIVFVCFNGCSENASPLNDISSKNTHYVSIDIDDIFQPNWDKELNQVGTVKMDESDVAALIDLSHELRSLFGEGFSFSLGYNSGFYDSSNSGDKALIINANEFRWFNHFPGHEHIEEWSFTSEQIEKLFITGKDFELIHGLTDYITSYIVLLNIKDCGLHTNLSMKILRNSKSNFLRLRH